MDVKAKEMVVPHEETMDVNIKEMEDLYDKCKNASPEDMRAILPVFRRNMEEKLFKHWGETPYDKTEDFCMPYLNLLLEETDSLIHIDKEEVTTDQRLLEELQTKLEKDINQGEKDYIVQEIDILYACKKIAMMLQQLNRILHDANASLDDKLREWIEKTLHEEPWEDYHNFVLYLTPEVLERAYALGDYGHDPQAHVDRIKALKDVNIEEINLKDQSISIIEKNLEAYLKEQKEACIKQDNNLSISNGPRIYARVEAVLSELSDRVLQITEEVGPQEVGPNRVEPTIQAADGVELPVRGSPFSGGYNGGSHNPVAANGYSYGYPQMPPPNYGGYPPQSGPRGASFNGHHSQGGYYGHGQGYALPLYHMVPLPMQLLFVQGGYYDGEHPPNYQQTAPPANQGFIYVDLRTQNMPVHSLPMDPIHNRYCGQPPVNTQPGYGQQPYNTRAGASSFWV